jgi:hypothetical protein
LGEKIHPGDARTTSSRLFIDKARCKISPQRLQTATADSPGTAVAESFVAILNFRILEWRL